MRPLPPPARPGVAPAGAGRLTVPFSGAVLCGGSSRRMGRDKATLLVDGVPMAGRVADGAARRRSPPRCSRSAGTPPPSSPSACRSWPMTNPAKGPFPPPSRPSATPRGTWSWCSPATSSRRARRPSARWSSGSGRPGLTWWARCRSSTATSSGPTRRGVERRWTPWRRPGGRGVGSLWRACTDLPLAPGPRPTGPRSRRCGPTWRSPRVRVASPTMDVPEIDVAELAARQADGAALIDVRTPGEFADRSGARRAAHPVRRGGGAHR